MGKICIVSKKMFIFDYIFVGIWIYRKSLYKKGNKNKV